MTVKLLLVLSSRRFLCQVWVPLKSLTTLTQETDLFDTDISLSCLCVTSRLERRHEHERRRCSGRARTAGDEWTLLSCKRSLELHRAIELSLLVLLFLPFYSSLLFSVIVLQAIYPHFTPLTLKMPSFPKLTCLFPKRRTLSLFRASSFHCPSSFRWSLLSRVILYNVFVLPNCLSFSISTVGIFLEPRL